MFSTGGHDVQFEGKRLYPLKFLTKHYTLRSYIQANRKLYQERFPRIRKERAERGWHVHYNALELVQEIKPWRKSELLNFDKATFWSDYLIERISGVGIELEERPLFNRQTAALLESEHKEKISVQSEEISQLRGELAERDTQVFVVEQQLRYSQTELSQRIAEMGAKIQSLEESSLDGKLVSARSIKN